jgi:hypothetical protein
MVAASCARVAQGTLSRPHSGGALRPLRRVAASALTASALLAASGCSVVSVAPDGSRTITGFVHLTLPAQTTSADRLRMRTVGAALVHTPLETQVIVGFSDATLTAIKPNSCALFGSGSETSGGQGSPAYHSD